jgi:hypothetical protein
LKFNFILIGIAFSIFTNTSISNSETTETSKCEADDAVLACKRQIPTAEANAKIKLLFGYPSNRYIIQNPIDINSCDTSKKCAVYLTTLKKLKSEYQACQYAKKKISKAHAKKVLRHINSIGMKAGNTLVTHMRNRQSDELRWLKCNYIVACEQGVTFLGQETHSLCQ